ncbi:Crp/Fnr family transcriptional regulator [Asaia sp. HN010]|uniref:Crp/Fnr family transcriptional regulator n=1 Tax=Asaia sp. HN010 TaxID=3081233 RepID=UPI0038CFDA93
MELPWTKEVSPIYGMDPVSDGDIIRDLREIGVEHRYQADCTLPLENDVSKFVLSITKGYGSVNQILRNGSSVTLGFCGPGDLIGFVMLNNPGVEFRCLSNVEAIRFPARQLRDLWQTHPKLQALFFAILDKRVQEMHNHIIALASHSAQRRVASFLIDRPWFGSAESGLRNTNDEIRLPLLRSEIASHLGLTQETVSRELRGLARAGIIKHTYRNHISILLPESLRDISRGCT